MSGGGGTLNGVKPISTSENITLYQLKSSTNNLVLTANVPSHDVLP